MASNENSIESHRTDEMYANRTNADLARIFARIADVLDVQGENPYKVRAYRNAVETLRSLDEPVSAIASEGRLGQISGFGDAIQAKIGDILRTGTTPLYDRLKDAVPAGVIEMLGLPGIGAKTVRQIWEGLGITNLEALMSALDDGRVAGLAGMGAKTADKLRAAIDKQRRFAGGLRSDEALTIAESVIAPLSARAEVERIDYAGSLRRGADVVDEIRLVARSSAPEQTIAAFLALPQVDRPVGDHGAGSMTARVVLGAGIEAELAIAEPGDYGRLLQERTGSESHNRKLTATSLPQPDHRNQEQPWPERHGYADQTPFGAKETSLPQPLSPPGKGEQEKSVLADEVAVYAALGLPWIPPTLREDTGEIEAALSGTLPRLVNVADIRGDVHAHTTATDGQATIAEMAAAARALGYEYMAITDHSYSLAMVGGLTPDRLKAQMAEIRAIEDSLGIRVFAGSEVDIKADGTLDFDDDLLAELDFVIASAHLHNTQTLEAQTRRLIKVIENPHVDLIAHPTGRLINRRDPYPLDIEAIIAAAARTGTALEINAAPERLDLKDSYAREAARHGVKIIINTDAHRTVEYGLMHFGIATAQRAWLTPDDVLNTRSLADFEAWLER